MLEGKIKFFNKDKGFGFIYTNKFDDHFFNVKDVDGFDLPNRGDIVKFESNSGKKGLFATQITITSSKQEEGKVSCPSCNNMVMPKTTHNPRKEVSHEVPITNVFGEELSGTEVKWYWQNAYVSGNCPLCGYEIWSN